MLNRRQFARHASIMGCSALLGACASKAPGNGKPANVPTGTRAAPATSEPIASISRVDLDSVRAHATRQAIARALHLSNRLGYGPKPGDIENILRQGESAYIAQQLRPHSIPLPAALIAELEALLTLRMPVADAVNEYQAAIAANQTQTATATSPGPQANAAINSGAAVPIPARQNRRLFIREVAFDVNRNRLLRAIDSPRQLEEVLVEFWYNHFNVFIGKGLDRVLTGHYEQQAIRPHVFGRFRDLLGATAKHPAMLFYLDNAQSVAEGFTPRRAGNTPQALASAPRGLNENYARELMELHTLGVDAGYSQKDVTELARILTGWTFDRRDTSGTAFRFDERRHDNGSKILLGHRVEPAGIAEGEWALDMLASHPATARHIAHKLAQYFVADQVPAALVDSLARRFTQTGGDIREVLNDLFMSNEFWNLDQTKFKTPYQFVVSSARAAGLSLPRNVLPLIGALNQMGMPLHGCPTPDGYKNTEAAWLNPEAMTRRLNFATALADGRLAFNREVDASQMQPLASLQGANRPIEANQPANSNSGSNRASLDWNKLINTLGSTIKTSTRTVIESSPPELRASLVLGSPEFMRK